MRRVSGGSVENDCDPTNLVPFSSHEREACCGLCLAIVRGIPGQAGTIMLRVESEMLKSTTATVQSIAAGQGKL